LSFGGISMRAAQETLREVEQVTRRGITVNTFMLDDSPSLRAFVERMTRINKGRALHTRPDRLGQYLLVDYLTKKRKRVGGDRPSHSTCASRRSTATPSCSSGSATSTRCSSRTRAPAPPSST